MVSITNDCGSRNGFGFFDSQSKEIFLRRPCFKKKEALEAYEWLDAAKDIGLIKFYIGIGNAESFVSDGYGDSLYSSARGVVKQAVNQIKGSDNVIIANILERLALCNDVRFLYLKCISFERQDELFLILLNIIKNMKNLVHLDLSGCYLSDEQLIELAEFISNSNVSQVVWPELRMGNMVMEEVIARFEKNRSIVIFESVPLEMQKIAKRNRMHILSMAKSTLLIAEDDVEFLKKHKESVKLAISYEKHRLVDVQKTLEAIIA